MTVSAEDCVARCPMRGLLERRLGKLAAPALIEADLIQAMSEGAAESGADIEPRTVRFMAKSVLALLSSPC